MMNGLKNIKTHKIFDIEYNGFAAPVRAGLEST
jgi:hypothetical protein